MNCTTGCIPDAECQDNTTFLITSLMIAFIGFCGGQFCYIVSLRRKLEEDTRPLIEEIPPPYRGEHESI